MVQKMVSLEAPLAVRLEAPLAVRLEASPAVLTPTPFDKNL